MLTPTVSVKNTKQQILDAYSNLLKIIEKQKEAMQTTGKSSSEEKQAEPLSFRARVIAKIDEIEKEVIQKKDEISTLTEQTEKLKSDLSLGRKFEFTVEEIRSLEEKINEEKREWDRRKIQLEKELEEDLKWQKQRLEKELQELRWNFEKEKEEKLLELRKSEEDFAKRASNYEDLKVKVGELDSVLEKEAKNVRVNVIKEKEEDFANERKILNQQFEYDKKLLEQKISDLEGRLKQQISENESQRTSILSLQTQIKDMAVAAMEKRIEVDKESSRR